MIKQMINQVLYTFATVMVVIGMLLLILNYSEPHDYPTTVEIIKPFLILFTNTLLSPDLLSDFQLIVTAMVNSGTVILSTAILTIFFSFLVGLYTSCFSSDYVGNLANLFNVTVNAVPEFIIAIIASLIYTYSLNSFPSSNDFLRENGLTTILLPTLVLTLYHAAYMSRVTYNSAKAVLKMPYIKYASMQGLTQKTIINQYVYHNALVKPISVFFAHINWIVSGLIVVEVYFQYDGIGRTFYQAAIYGDTNLLFTSACVCIIFVALTRMVAKIYQILQSEKADV